MSEGDWIGTIALTIISIALIGEVIKGCIRQYWQNRKDYEEKDLIK